MISQFAARRIPLPSSVAKRFAISASSTTQRRNFADGNDLRKVEKAIRQVLDAATREKSTTPNLLSEKSVDDTTSLSIPALKAALEEHDADFSDCFDKDSLRKRLREVRALRGNRVVTEDLTPKREPMEFMPRVILALSPTLTGNEKPVLVMAPIWDFEQIRKVASLKISTKALIRERQRQHIAEQFAAERAAAPPEYPPYDVEDEKQIGVAAMFCYFCEPGEDDIQLVNPRDIGLGGMYSPQLDTNKYYPTCIMPDSPVPRGWTPTLGHLPLEEQTNTMKSIENARNALGESELVDWSPYKHK